MRAIMQSFMEQHPHDPRADDSSKKEAAIVRPRPLMDDMNSS